jgi:hypothetical protein
MEALVMVVIKLRQGIGFDIEFNEDICHIVEGKKEGEDDFVAFSGVLIKLPFLVMYIGDFFDLD